MSRTPASWTEAPGAAVLLDRAPVRITYWIAPGRRIVLLTVFTKTRMREEQQIERARTAMARCIAARHTAEEDSHG